MRREIRLDPTTGDEVLLCEARPHERKPPQRETPPEDCPFCPGHEHSTRPTIAQILRADRWVARAFANRSPVLVVEERDAVSVSGGGLLQSRAGLGAHEVIVEAPEHAPLHELPLSRSEDALMLARERLRDLRRDTRLKALTWFRNQGVGAGASQSHPHAQIVGTPYVPRRLAAYADRSREYLAKRGRPLLPDVLAAEREAGRSLFDGEVSAVCPFAPRYPFEVWLVPARLSPHLADAGDPEIRALARALWRASRALVAALGPIPMTVTALCAPEEGERASIGWHIRLAPRLVAGAGLEELTGLAVHSVFPEDAAPLLRSSLPPDSITLP